MTLFGIATVVSVLSVLILTFAAFVGVENPRRTAA